MIISPMAAAAPQGDCAGLWRAWPMDAAPRPQVEEEEEEDAQVTSQVDRRQPFFRINSKAFDLPHHSRRTDTPSAPPPPPVTSPPFNQAMPPITTITTSSSCAPCVGLQAPVSP